MSNTPLTYEVVITTNGQTGFVKLGNGTPLIMLVGYSGNLLHWNSELVYSLAQQYTVYLIDNRRVGLSNSTNEDSMLGLAHDIVDFIHALNINQPIICGWSMGGIIAQALAMNYQHLIKGMVLIVSQPDYSYTYGNLHQLVTNLRENPSKEARERLIELFYSTSPSIEFRKYLAKAILPINRYVYPFNETAQQLQNIAVTSWQTNHQQLAQITLPVLISVAKNDLVTKPEASYVLHNLLPNSKLISYPDGGHFFLHHYPLELANQIKSLFI